MLYSHIIIISTVMISDSKGQQPQELYVICLLGAKHKIM